jgi:hypothetical protein
MSCPAFVAQVPRRAEDSSFIGADSWVRMSQRTFRPAFEGPTEQSDHLGASLPHNLHFLGRIIVSYSAGRSVTVSKWGGGWTNDQGTEEKIDQGTNSSGRQVTCGQKSWIIDCHHFTMISS